MEARPPPAASEGAATVPTVPQVTLANGVEIPQLGFGVFQIDPDETVEAVGAALGIGYRHIDTAEMYGNERQVGEAIARSGLDPSEVFVTSKLNNNHIGFDAALRGFEGTLAALGTERIDLFLIHWPLPTVRDYVETWKALETVYAEGRARAIGVSNFQPDHLRRLLEKTEIAPAVNQIEVHPYLTQEQLLAFDAEHHIATEAWSPIAQGEVLDDPVIVEVAEAHGRTPAQVVLRWHLQRGSIVFPKSVDPGRMRENFALFDFELPDADMERLTGLNRDHRTGPDPDTFDYVPG
jgi:2,5-diketo-D-gluconate reductase A